MVVSKKIGVCAVCGKRYTQQNLSSAQVMREGVFELTKKSVKGFHGKSKICTKCLTTARAQYVEGTLKDEQSDISKLQTDVFSSIKKQEVITSKVYKQYKTKITAGERLSDKIAEFGGSWKFLTLFGVFLGLWIVVNTFLLFKKPFDPYPFILLNLILSTLAAIQAPVIMMSQNRQESRDRLRSEHDYKINMKAELEIRFLHEKLDLLLKNHWNRLLQIQQMQIDVLEEIKKKKR